ncbi:MAG TPA: M48 family metallopeptidase [Gemmataceae bacterium]|jgi:predicted Zn-dependent protease|nr:M48 family metallopeptidase [Gemmataceae bacterium]
MVARFGLELVRENRNSIVRRPRTIVRSIIIVAACLSGAGCDFGGAPNGQGPGHRPQRLLLNPRQELAVGRQAFQEIEGQLPEVSRGEGPRRVEVVGRRIADTTKIEPLMREINLHTRGFYYEWEFKLFQSSEVNAFCLPGGKVGVFTGMLPVVANDDQLAAVLAHEIAHALAHHTSERLAREQALGGGILAKLGGLRYDREQESEADHIGVFLMTFAGYAPGEAVAFWERMAEASGRGGQLPEVLRTHPSDEHRVAQLRDWVPRALGAKRAYDEGRIAPAR